MSRRCSQLDGRSGFTLLELLLTLSLAVVLMFLIGGIIQFYGRDMVNSDLEVRQVQLASAVMQMIEDDLRSTLHTEPVDTSAIEDLLASAGSSASGGGGGGAAMAGAGTAGSEATADESASEEDLSTTEETSTLAVLSGSAVLETPGLIGNQYQLQIDVSKLPRLEEYVTMFDETNANLEDVPSDIKTITYFVQDEGVTGVSDPLSQFSQNQQVGSSGGLVRRSLDRAASVHAALTGGITRLNQTGKLLAPEIVAIEFSYWDGYMWQLEWSSDEFGELPLAVKVMLTMLDPTVSAVTGEPATRNFTHVVRLPMAQPIETEEDSVTETVQ